MSGFILINNKTNLEVFDIFNEIYGAKALFLFPDFEEIQINAVYHYDSSDKDSFNEFDTFGFYYDYLKEQKYAEIIIHLDACERLELTNEEKLAAIAHELGHIRYTEIYQTSDQGQVAEMECDEFACKLGLSRPLASQLLKLTKYRILPDQLTQFINDRLFNINLKSIPSFDM